MFYIIPSQQVSNMSAIWRLEKSEEEETIFIAAVEDHAFDIFMLMIWILKTI